MATTPFSTDAAQTISIWSALLMKQAQKQTYFKKFMGTSQDDMIQKITDLEKGEKGDTIKYDLLMNLVGEGVDGDSEIEGNEEQLVFYQDSVDVNLRGNGVRAAGKMSMKRTKRNIQTNGKTALGNWMGQLTDDDFVLALSGLVNSAGQTTAVAPDTSVSATDSGHKWCGGDVAASGSFARVAGDSSLVQATHRFNTQTISAVKRHATVKCNPMLRPLKIDGVDHFVMLIHPYQLKALRAETAWLAAQRDAGVRGNKNPIFSGAAGIWDDVIIHSYAKITTRLGAGGTAATEAWETTDTATNILGNAIYGARALFCGAQAGVVAYGQYPGWYEKNFDYGRVPGVATDVVYGIKKTRYNSKDFGVIAVDTVYVSD